jgi:Dimerisation domain
VNVDYQTGRRKTAAEEVTDTIFLNKWSSQTLWAGAELGVFDFLSRDGTRTASDVAADIGLDAPLLYRLLRALASLGLLNETLGRHFSLTERGALLYTDAPGSLRYIALLIRICRARYSTFRR